MPEINEQSELKAGNTPKTQAAPISLVPVKNVDFLDICLLNSCNYRCQYCISKSLNAYYQNFSDPFMKEQQRFYWTAGWSLKPVQLLQFIKSHFRPNETAIQLSGGEPLLWDSLPFVIKELIALGYRFGINTNGYLLKQFLRWFPCLHTPDLDASPTVCKWRVSWHPMCRSWELFKKDIEPFKLIPKSVLINYVVHPMHIANNYIKEHIEALEAFKMETGIRHERTPMAGNWNGKEYSKFDAIFEPYLTEPGPAIKANYFSIQANGDIMKCHKLKLGNIYENTFAARNFESDPVCVFPENFKFKHKSACGALSSYGILGLFDG